MTQCQFNDIALWQGLSLRLIKSECYTEKADGDANERLMSLSPSVINKQHSDLWVSRVAGIATTYISGIGFHHIYDLIV